jgi:large subunit ribosomal protein L10
MIPGDKGKLGRAAMSNPANWRQTVERAEKREFVTELNEVFKASVRLSWPTMLVSQLRR